MYLSSETTLKPVRMRNLFKNCIHLPAGVSAVDKKINSASAEGFCPRITLYTHEPSSDVRFQISFVTGYRN